jgi:hypothetical protein
MDRATGWQAHVVICGVLATACGILDPKFESPPCSSCINYLSLDLDRWDHMSPPKWFWTILFHQYKLWYHKCLFFEVVVPQMLVLQVVILNCTSKTNCGTKNVHSSYKKSKLVLIDCKKILILCVDTSYTHTLSHSLHKCQVLLIYVVFWSAQKSEHWGFILEKRNIGALNAKKFDFAQHIYLLL